MEKAYDTKDLLKKLEGRGLDLAEDAAALVLEEVLNWFEDSAKMSENKYDDLVIAIIPMLREEVLKQIDRIDGEEG